MIGGMIIQGIIPARRSLRASPNFLGLIASMWVTETRCW